MLRLGSRQNMTDIDTKRARGKCIANALVCQLCWVFLSSTVIYVAAKATYIRLLHGKIGIFGGFFGPSSVHTTQGSDPYSAWMKYVVCPHLYIPWKFGERRSTPRGDRRPSLSFFVRHATLLGTESPDGAYTYWTWGERATGIRPPDSFSYRSNFRSSFSFSFSFRSSFRFRSRSSSCSTTSGDIFYCSGSRQLNHSS